MTDYAVLDELGEVLDIVTTDRDPRDISRAMEDVYRVVPLEKVPMAVLERYRYWRERP